MKKIAIASLDSINNAGDELLGRSTAYLVECCDGEFEIERKQLMPTYKQLMKDGYLLSCLAIPFNYIAQKLKQKGRLAFLVWRINYYIKYKSYYRSWIKRTDKIILPVGMLKFANQNFCFIFDLINTLASQYDKPVLMNAMSIAKPDEGDPRYIQLVKAVNMPTVWGITSRDGIDGLTALRRDYVRKEINTDFVGDLALWVPEIYGKSSHTFQEGKNKMIGVNLIRKSIFASYKEENFSSADVKKLYKEIAKELDSRGYEWVFFCNGMSADYNFGLELIRELHLPKEKLIDRPMSAKEYVDMVSQFKAVFGARLHACITSVALGIPVVGMLWDNKLKYFSKTMGIEKFFISASNLSGENVVNSLEEAMEFPFDYANRESYKERTAKYIEKFICEI